MGHSEFHITQAIELRHLNKDHKFYIVNNNFPIYEDGIFGLPFFHKYPDYAIRNNEIILTLEDLPLTLYEGVPITRGKVQNIILETDQKNGEVIARINDRDTLHTIKNHKITIPIINNGESDLTIATKDIKLIPVKHLANTIKQTTERKELLRQNTRLEHIEPQTRIRLWEMIRRYDDIFTLPGDELPCTPMTTHKIVLREPKIINIKSYRLPECHQTEINKQIIEMLDKRIVKPSDSPYNSPLWVVPKKADASGRKKWRLVIDFRKINDLTDQDAYPLPIIEEILGSLGQAKFFSAFDLSAGFHQIEMDEESRKYTAFSTREGH